MEIDLKLLWVIFIKRIWVIALGFIVAASAAYAYCEYLVSPEYKATASILVTNGAITQGSDSDLRTSVAATDITASLSLVNTVTDILKTPETYRKAAKASNGKFKYEEILNTATVTSRDTNTLFIDISFTDSNSKKAIELSNVFAEASCDYISEVIPYSNAIVVAKSIRAILVFPKTFSIMAISGLAVAVLIYVIFFFTENNNKIIRSEEDFSNKFKIPVIGTVPDFENGDVNTYEGYKKGK